jgi:hypothetical protein
MSAPRRYPWYDTTCGILLALLDCDIVDPAGGSLELAAIAERRAQVLAIAR